MRAYLAGAILITLVVVGRADDTIANAQRILKDQGFYYGQINGQKDTVTTDAIRRYQIRNGLQINGELNDETLRSLKSASAATPSPAPNVASAPSSTPDTSDLRDDSARNNNSANSSPYQPYVPSGPPPRDDGSATLPPGTVVPPRGGLFAGTPYETAPPEVQRKVIRDAQLFLARRGLFRDLPDGYYGPSLEFSLRAYQARVGLPVTGRFDLETLAALQLLPGAHTPVYTRRPRGFIPGEPPPVRGEWVRP